MKLKPLDGVAAVSVTAAALASLFVLIRLTSAKPDITTAVITTDSGTYTMPLNEDAERTFQSNGHTLTVKVENGLAYIADSTCPDKLCVDMGYLDFAGDSAVCLPAACTVRVEGRENLIDGIVG